MKFGPEYRLFGIVVGGMVLFRNNTNIRNGHEEAIRPHVGKQKSPSGCIHTEFIFSQFSTQRAQAAKKALTDFAKTYNKQEAAACSYLSGHHTMATQADYFNVHYATISRWVKGYEG